MRAVALLLRLVPLLLCLVRFPHIEAACEFAGSTYRSGEVWHPVLHPLGTMPCINCTCLKSGEVTCEGDRCPALDCESPVQVHNKCCPVCQDVSSDSEQPLASHLSCYHGEEVFEHNEVFASNVSAIKPTKDNQCVLCTCLDGDVICHLKTCVPPSCQEPRQSENDCCPVCLNNASITTTSDTNPNGGPDSERDKADDQKDCHSGEKTYKHGDSWHPVIGQFGQVNCVQCRCKRGVIKCRREECQREQDLHCAHPVIAEGSCCKTCPATGSSRPIHPTQPYGTHRKRRRKNKRRRQTPPPQTTNSGDLKACAPKGTHILVYTLQDRNQIVWVLQPIRASRSDWLTWTLNAETFTNLRTQWQQKATLPAGYELIGATKKGLVKKLKKRASKLWNRTCRRKGHCTISSLQPLLTSQLRLQDVEYKQSC